MDKWAQKTSNQLVGVPKLLAIILLSIFPITSMFVLGLAVFLVYIDITRYNLTLINAMLGNIMPITLSIFLLYLSYSLINSSLAKYRFEAEGIRIKYPLRRSCVIPWREFQQVCICYAAYTTFGPRKANTVICAVKHGEKPNMYGRWKTDNPFRYRTVIRIEYCEDRHMQLREYCPLPIIDLRNAPEYKL